MSYNQRSKHEDKILQSGTKLPLMDLKGKPYLQVAHRIVWFREERPEATIETQVSYDDKTAVARAVISDNGKILATAHKRETFDDFPTGHIEKAETGAIGRALALCGYGTQFEPEFDEGERLADAPIPVARKESPVAPKIGNQQGEKTKPTDGTEQHLKGAPASVYLNKTTAHNRLVLDTSTELSNKQLVDQVKALAKLIVNKRPEGRAEIDRIKTEQSVTNVEELAPTQLQTLIGALKELVNGN